VASSGGCGGALNSARPLEGRQREKSGADGARTRDLLAASQTLSQLSYGPKLRSKSSVQSAKGLPPQGTVSVAAPERNPFQGLSPQGPVPVAAPNRDPFRIVPAGDCPGGVTVVAAAPERNPFQGQSPFGDSPLTTP
jgi:hypothetical protein